MSLLYSVFIVIAISAITSGEKEITTETKKCINITQVDLVMLMDASTSIGPSHWKIEKEYVMNFMNSFSKGIDNVRFGAVMFNDLPNKLYHLKDHINPLAAANALKNISYPGIKGTNTHLALNQVMSSEMFSEANGGRGDISDVLVVLTDGRSGEPALTKEEVDKLHAAGIDIITVGIGKVNKEELASMSTKSMKVFSADYQHLWQYIKETYTTEICKPTEVVPCKNYTNTRADIILLIDASTSIKAPNWKIQVDFASDVVQAFTVGSNDVLFGCVIFNRYATTKFNLSTYMDQTSLSESLKAIEYPNVSGTQTHKGLSHILDNGLFGSTAGGRDRARDLVIVMTDGRSDNFKETEREATRLKENDVTVISVGIGAYNITELIAMASSLDYVLRTPSYQLLDFIKADLVTTTCDTARRAV